MDQRTITYISGYDITLEEATVLGPCPECVFADVVLGMFGVGECRACRARYTVELIVRMALIKRGET